MMQAVFATLLILVLTYKMADSVICYECSAETAAECGLRRLHTTFCTQSMDRRFEKMRKEHSLLNQATLTKVVHKYYQSMRDLIERRFCNAKLYRIVLRRLANNTPDPVDAVNDWKLLATDETLPMEAQYERAQDWMTSMDKFFTEEKIDLKIIENLNNKFIDDWRNKFGARVKKKKKMGDEDQAKEWQERMDALTEEEKDKERTMMKDFDKELRNKYRVEDECNEDELARQSVNHKDLISNDNTADNWCATFESKELGFHLGCGVVLKGVEFEPGCHAMSGAYEGVTYCRCDSNKCNGNTTSALPDAGVNAVHDAGSKFKENITIILMATVIMKLL